MYVTNYYKTPSIVKSSSETGFHYSTDVEFFYLLLFEGTKRIWEFAGTGLLFVRYSFTTARV